jgi:mannose-6-phosphate isomerase-like protein (cupin superfamily)
MHRLENKHNNPLEIIEIQVGVYLGEDDITRIEDEYSRN